jgi:threonine dehydrogenase-like Zn-dependent dehydrogenase
VPAPEELTLDTSVVTSRQPLVVAPETVDWRVRDLAPHPGPGQVRLRTRLSLVSAGTEVRLYRGEPMAAAVWASMSDLGRFSPHGAPAVVAEADEASVRFPVSVGYNAVAEVVAVGDGVERPAVGQRVFAHARHVELVDLQAWEVVPIPDGVDDLDAAPAYMSTLGLHALRRAGWVPGEPVVIIGLGLVGLCAALVAGACGAELVCIEASPARRAIAQELLPAGSVHGPDAAVSDLTAHLTRRRLALAIDAAGGEAPLRLAMSLLEAGGRVTVLAMHPEPLGPLMAGLFYERELSFVSTSNDPYEPEGASGRFTRGANIAFVLGLIDRGRLSLRGVATHTLPATEIGAAYADLASGAHPDMLCAVLDWRAISP